MNEPSTTPDPIRSLPRDQAIKAIINLCGEHKVNLEFIQRLNHILDGWETWTKGMLHRHVENICPVCHEFISNPPLDQVCYFFEPCDCGEESYTHLGERMAHRKCVTQLNEDQLPQEFIETNLPEMPIAMFMGVATDKMSRRDLQAIIGWHRREIKRCRTLSDITREDAEQECYNQIYDSLLSREIKEPQPGAEDID